MKKKILFVHHYSLISGAEKVLINILENIDASRFQPVLCCPCGELGDQISRNGINFYPCNIPTLKKTYNPFSWGYFLYRNIAITIRLVRIIRKEEIDIIYANSFIACLFCCLAAKLFKAPMIWHMHDLIKCNSVNKIFVRLSSKFSKTIIATTQVMKDSLILCGADEEKIEVVYNGIDPAQYDVTKVDKIRFKRELGLSPETALVGIVGQLTPWKGHREFLQAASITIRELPDVRFLIVGDSRLGDDNTYCQQLEDWVMELGLKDSVIFTGFRKDIDNVIGSLDILVNASWSEPFGMTIIEAMAIGVPVVATKAGGVSEIIDDGINGMLFDVGDTEQLAQKWIDLLRQTDILKSIRCKASDIFYERFLLSEQLNKIESIISNC